MSVTRSLLRPAALFALVIAVAAIGWAQASASQAATPGNGTVSASRTSVSWGGGPFAAPNPTGGTVSDAPDCTAPQSCDDYTLRVQDTASYAASHQLKISVSWSNTAADFDVYVLDAQGNTVATSASSADPEQVTLPAGAATYTVRVVPYLPAGASYTAKATLVAKPADPAVGTDTRPGFRNFAAPDSLGDAHNAGEPSIGTNFATNATMYQAYLSTYKVRFNDEVSPTKATWSDVSANAANGCAVGSTQSLDPILFTDHATGRTFESQLAGATSLTCYTDDDGKTWFPSTGGGIPSGVDHQTIGGGPYSRSGLGALPTSAYPNAVYYCSQSIATAFCAISHDGGTTFGNGVPTYNLQQCGGLHGHVKVGPDGTAYLPNKACGKEAAAVVSIDNGQSWTVHTVPGSSPSDADPSVGVGKKGTVYFGYVGADGRPAAAVSRDHGKTWTRPQPVGLEYKINNAVFPTVVAGDDGRAAFAFIGTPTDGNYQDQATFHGVWHLYVATTYDGGKTWQTSDATPKDAVQRGSICTGGTTCGDDRNLLDFIDVTIDKQGRVEVGYADGCTGACVSDPSTNNHDALATIARQTSGKPLFAKYDPKPNLTVRSLAVHRSHGRFVATARVHNAGRATARSVRTAFFDNRRRVGVRSGYTLAPGATRTLRVSWKHRGGKHRVRVIMDPRHAIAETNESDNVRAVRRR